MVVDTQVLRDEIFFRKRFPYLFEFFIPSFLPELTQILNIFYIDFSVLKLTNKGCAVGEIEPKPLSSWKKGFQNCSVGDP
jgi:hypothetical protein